MHAAVACVRSKYIQRSLRQRIGEQVAGKESSNRRASADAISAVNCGSRRPCLPLEAYLVQCRLEVILEPVRNLQALEAKPLCDTSADLVLSRGECKKTKPAGSQCLLHQSEGCPEICYVV